MSEKNNSYHAETESEYGGAENMQHILKTVITLLISLLMQSGVVNLISTTPHDAVSDFMDGPEKPRQQCYGKIHG